MRPIGRDGVAWYVYVCLSVGHFVSPAKTSEPIEMPFGGMTHMMGPRNRELRLGRDLPMVGAILWSCHAR